MIPPFHRKLDDGRFDVAGKVVIITGGCGLVGSYLAKRFRDWDAQVIVLDTPQAIRRLRAKGWEGQRIHPMAVSVTDERTLERLARRIRRDFGPVDVLVNCAIGRGSNYFGPVERYKVRDWREIMDVNVLGTFLPSRVFVKVMAKRGASVINFGSIYGIVSPRHTMYGSSGLNSPAAYAASKGAVIALTRYLACYWSKRGVRVNAVSPGGIESGQQKAFLRRYGAHTPAGSMARLSDVEGPVRFLASDASRYVTGHNLVADGGWTAW